MLGGIDVLQLSVLVFCADDDSLALGWQDVRLMVALELDLLPLRYVSSEGARILRHHMLQLYCGGSSSGMMLMLLCSTIGRRRQSIVRHFGHQLLMLPAIV